MRLAREMHRQCASEMELPSTPLATEAISLGAKTSAECKCQRATLVRNLISRFCRRVMQASAEVSPAVAKQLVRVI